jgi:hypothetical protein
MRPVLRRVAALLPFAWSVLLMTGCNAIGIFGVATENYKRTSTHEIKGEYEGLKGKTFAVVVATDRSIQAMYPQIVDVLCDRITQRLHDESGATGYVPAGQVLKYMYDHPVWISRPMSELAKSLGGVDRIVYIDLYEYRLNDPGNAYEWSGVAAGTLSVLEIDSALPDSHAFERNVQVKYPDKPGFGPGQMAANVVSSTLVKRFVDRATWIFYDHQEPYYPDY